VGLVALVLVVGCGGDNERQTVTVEMEEQMGSTQFGEAVLMELEDSRTRIEISVGLGGADGIQPARIVRGSCDDDSPEPIHALENVMEGESVSEIDLALDELLGRGYAITVYEAPELLRIRAVCGEIPSGSRR
jgi:hypothetical protein